MHLFKYPFFVVSLVSTLTVLVILGYMAVKKIRVAGYFPFYRSVLTIAYLCDLTITFLASQKINNWAIIYVLMNLYHTYWGLVLLNILPPTKRSKIVPYYWIFIILSLVLQSLNYIQVLSFVWVTPVTLISLLAFAIYVFFWYMRFGPNHKITHPILIFMVMVIIAHSLNALSSLFFNFFNFTLPYYVFVYVGLVWSLIHIYILRYYIKEHQLLIIDSSM